MGQARELMDRLTEAVVSANYDAIDEVYASDVVITTPDQGTITGLDAAKAWHRSFGDAFDMTFEMERELETADCAIDQGTALATHTGDMPLPDGTTLPPTGKQVRLRACDVATVANGKIVRHDFYFDQLEMMAQLGLLEQPASTTSG